MPKSKSFALIRKRFVLISMMVFVLGGLALVFWSNFLAKQAKAAWWNDGWTYRQTANVTNSSGSEQTNYQVKITLNTSALISKGKMRSDCNDIRVTNVSGTLLPHWVDKNSTFTCGTTSTNIWTKIDSVSTTGTTLFIYYGNAAAASVESGKNTFNYFDNFDDNTVDSALWNALGTGTKEEVNAQQHTANSGTFGHARFGLQSAFNTANTAIEFDVKFPVGSGWNQKAEFGLCDGAFSGCRWFGFFNASANFRIYTLISSVWDWREDSSYVFSNNVTYHVKVVDLGTSVQFTVTEGATTRYTSSTINYDATSAYYLYFGDGDGGDESYRDNWLIRKNVTNGPSVGTPFNEEIGSLQPVAYWKFDEGYGTVAHDSSSQGNTAVAGSFPTWTTENSCKFGKCLSFNGSANYLVAGNGSSLQQTGSMSISAWVKLNANNAQENIVAKKGASGQWAYNLFSSATGKLSLEVSNDGNVMATASGTTTLQTGTWYHVAGVFNAADANNSNNPSIRVYVNGAQNGVNTSPGFSTLKNSSANVEIGSENSGGKNLLNGYLDNVKVYPYALTASQVGSDYNSKGSFGGQTGVSYSAASSDGNPPVGYWNFEEGQGTSVNDKSASSSAKLGSWNGTGSHWTQGKFGKGGNFNGTDDFVSMANSIPNAKTVEFWVNPTSTTTNLIGFDASHYISASSGTLSATGFSSPVYYVDGVSSSTIVANKWQHIVVTTSTGAAGGAITFGKANGAFLSGKMDEVQIYDYVRTPGQIVQDMNGSHPLGGSPVGSQALYWKFDEGYGSLAHDSGPNSVGGNITGGSFITDGKFGKAFKMNVTTDNVSAGDVSFVDSVSALSQSLWVRPQVIGTTMTILGKWNDSAASNSFLITTDSSSQSEIKVYVASATTDTTGNAPVLTTSGLGLVNGTWTQLTIVYDGSLAAGSRLKVYKNGVLVSSSISGTMPTTMTTGSTTALKLGAMDNPTTGLIGEYDEVQIYSAALSVSDVKIVANQGQATVYGAFGTLGASAVASNSANATYCVPGDATSCSPPLADWEFEEGSGTIVNDISGNNYAGTFNNGGAQPISWKPAGQIGSALKFPDITPGNTGDYVDIGNPAAFNLQVMTVEAWINYSGGACGSGFCGFFSHGPGATAGYGFFLLSGSGNTLQFDIMDQLRANSVTPVPTNSWHHVAATVGGNGTSVIIYVDGRLDTITSQTQAIDYTGVQNVVIGNSNPTSGSPIASLFFPGMIDQVRVYNYVRTPAQIAWDYNQGKPQTWWKFDECSGTTAHDSVGTVSGTLAGGTAGDCNTSSTAWFNGKTGKYNYSMSFGSSPNVTTVTSAQTYPFSQVVSSNASWGGWFKPTSTINSQGMMEKTNQFRVYTNASGNAICGIYNGGAYRDSTSVTAPITLNSWNHVICTYDGTNLKTYVNGILKKTSSGGNFANGISPTTTSLVVGEKTEATSTFFTGQIDAVKVWNYPLTAYQILLDMNQAGGVRMGPTTGAPQ